MASVKGRLPLLAETHGVTETLEELNRSLVDELERREFVALCYARYDPATGEFEMANAGLPDPYLFGADGTPSPVQVSGPRLPLGVNPEIAYESCRGRLAPGERLLLLTDGLPEAPLPDGGPIGYAELEALLARAEGNGESWLDDLFSSLESVVGTAREDDWTALLLERTPAP